MNANNWLARKGTDPSVKAAAAAASVALALGTAAYVFATTADPGFGFVAFCESVLELALDPAPNEAARPCVCVLLSR